jgi:hypothetical protein
VVALRSFSRVVQPQLLSLAGTSQSERSHVVSDLTNPARAFIQSPFRSENRTATPSNDGHVHGTYFHSRMRTPSGPNKRENHSSSIILQCATEMADSSGLLSGDVRGQRLPKMSRKTQPREFEMSIVLPPVAQILQKTKGDERRDKNFPHDVMRLSPIRPTTQI